MRARLTLPGLVFAVCLFASACGGGGDDDVDSRTSFTDFVQDLALTPVDNADPVAIDATDFTFSEDPNAFDALFQ